eukprot:TRINITY_DN5534_c0_g1_i1.p1 TRINITY_DN5534_c0_g1~~TRINITY_DN5534_c0_g1_i1.p1  ORF type:complete len:562 (-),score=100.76 TRINITY_DN5534_c0_g1_i1:470-2155(-)
MQPQYQYDNAPQQPQQPAQQPMQYSYGQSQPQYTYVTQPNQVQPMFAQPSQPTYQPQPTYVQQQQPVVYYQQPVPNYYAPQPQSQPNNQYMAPQPIQNQAFVVPTSTVPMQSADDPNKVTLSNGPQDRFQGNTYRDVFFSVLFWIQFFVIFVLACYYYNKMRKDNKDDWKPSLYMNGASWALAFLLLAVAVFFSVVMLHFMKTAPRKMIYWAFGMEIAFMAFFAIFSFAVGAIGTGVICVIVLLIEVLWIYLVRSRIEFAAQMLSICTNVVKAYPSTIWVCFGSILVQVFWVIIFVMAVTGIYSHYERQGSESSSYGGVGFLLLVSFYWVGQVIKNVVAVTVGGVFATWWFTPANQMPQNPTWTSFKRATTYSFGSICLGSLIVAVIRALRAVAESGKNSNNNFLRCAMICLLQCLERIMQYFNQYAFATVAIYGVSYTQAARRTWELFTQKLFTAIINDNIVGMVLMWSAISVGLIDCAIGGIGANVSDSIGNYGVWATIGFLAGLCICLIAMEVIESAVVTCFVCWCDDPAALQQTHPEVYQELSDAISGRKAQLENPQ